MVTHWSMVWRELIQNRESANRSVMSPLAGEMVQLGNSKHEELSLISSHRAVMPVLESGRGEDLWICWLASPANW